MRILLANEARSGAGGVETYLASVADGLRGRGHDVALLFANSAAEAGPTRIASTDSWSVADAGLEHAIACARQWNPEVCFAHNMRDLRIDDALLGQWPVVKMMHGYFGTCVSGQKAFLTPGPAACARTCGPACLVHYLPRRCGRLRPVEVVRNYRWSARQRSLLPRYESIVVASAHMRAEYIAHGVAPEDVHAIPLFAAAPPAARVAGGAPVDVVFLGRMTDLKGPSLLLDALAAAAQRIGSRVTVVLAGDGPRRERLRAAAATLPGVGAEFPGWIDAEARSALFARAALLAVPSVWPEPFGLVGLEAAAFGVPAVAFDVGGIREWLTDGINGRLIPAGDRDAMGLAIATLLRDPAERARLGRGALAASTRFSPSAHLSQVEAVLAGARAS